MFHFFVPLVSLASNLNESEKALQSIRHVTEGFYVERENVPEGNK